MVPGQDQGQAAIMAKPKKINLNTAIASKQGERRTISEEQRVKLRSHHKVTTLPQRIIMCNFKGIISQDRSVTL